MDKHELLADLRCRLDRLDCVCQPMKRLVLDLAENLDAAELAHYLDEVLAFVEREIAVVNLRLFRDLCVRLKRLHEPEEILAALGLNTAFAPREWLLYAAELEMDKVACLYCLANHYVLPANGRFPIEFTADLEALAISMLADALAFVGRRPEGVKLLESFLGLRPADYAADDLADRLDQRFDRRQITAANNKLTYVRTLADALAFVGQRPEGVKLLESFTREFAFLEDEIANGPVPENNIQSLVTCLQMAGESERGKTLARLGRVVPYLKRAIRRTGVSFEGRKLFLRRIVGLRQQVVDLYRFWAMREDDPARAEKLHRQAVLVDVELGQRLLLERFLFGKLTRAGDDGADAPVNQWPIVRRRVSTDWLSRWRGHLPPRNGWDGFDPTCNALALCAFDTVPDSAASVVAPRPGDVQQDVAGPWLDEAERIVAEDLTEERLARKLGENTLLLRAMFAPDGTLRWLALLSHGDRLETLADNWRAPTSPLDQPQLQWATAHHDLEVSLLYLVAKAVKDDTVLEHLVKLVRGVAVLRDELTFKNCSPVDLSDCWGQLLPPASSLGLGLLFQSAYRPLVFPAANSDPADLLRMRTLSIKQWPEVVGRLATAKALAEQARIDAAKARSYCTTVSSFSPICTTSTGWPPQNSRKPRSGRCSAGWPAETSASSRSWVMATRLNPPS